MTDLTKWMEPGIFRYECIPRKKSYFGEGVWVFSAAQEFAEDVKSGICENAEFLKDVQTYGFKNFTAELYILGPNFLDNEKRKQALADYKKSWTMFIN